MWLKKFSSRWNGLETGKGKMKIEISEFVLKTSRLIKNLFF